MKINDKILSLPPYISTSWSNISSIRMKGNQISITLLDGDTISIPSLSQEIIEIIFKNHAEHLEKQGQEEQQPHKVNGQFANQFPLLSQIMAQEEQGNEPPFRFGISSLEGFGGAMQHNPDQSDAPDLPQQMLEKISSIAKILAPEDSESLPVAEIGCNCFHCQIARAINMGVSTGVSKESTNLKFDESEEIVTDEELQFCEWDITPVGDKLFQVTNRLDKNEQYRVFLGEPIGCTCGQQGCEHIVAVLKS